MNKPFIFSHRFGLFVVGLVATLLLAFTGHAAIAIVLWFALDCLLSRRTSVCWINAFGTLATATIIQEALALVFTKRPILRNIAMGFTDDKGNPIAQFLQNVITRTFAVATVNDFGTGATFRADVDVPVTLDQFKELHHAFSIQEISSTSRDLVRESAEPLAVGLANSMVDAIAAKWTVANFPGNKTVKGAGWDYAHLLTVRAALMNRGVPQGMERFYACNEAVYTSLLQDPIIIAAFNNPANGLAIQKGELPTVAGTRIDEYPAIPANATNLIGFSGTPDSVVYAARVPRNPEEMLPGAKFPGNLGIVTEPRTGLSVMVNEWIDPATLKTNVRLIWMYGVAVGNPVNGQLITSQ